MSQHRQYSEDQRRALASVKTGDLAALKRYVEETGDVDLRNENDAPLLLKACYFGHLDCAEYLVLKGADVNAVDGRGDTALVAVSRENCAAGNFIRLLVGRGAHIDYRCPGESTALIEAVSHGHVQTVRDLVNWGADINAVTENEETALSYAIVWHFTDIAKILIEAGADVKWKGKKGGTPLRWAVFEGNKEIIELALERGADPEDLHLPIKNWQSVEMEKQLEIYYEKYRTRKRGRGAIDRKEKGTS